MSKINKWTRNIYTPGLRLVGLVFSTTGEMSDKSQSVVLKSLPINGDGDTLAILQEVVGYLRKRDLAIFAFMAIS